MLDHIASSVQYDSNHLIQPFEIHMKHWSHTALSDHPEEAWVNGAGLTRTLQVWPDANNWSLRISVATIETSAPYSKLPGTQRWHTLLQGRLLLTLPNQTQALDVHSAPFQFDGDWPCDCQLIEGPAMAFNVMLRGAYTARVWRFTASNIAQPFQKQTDTASKIVFAGFYTQTQTRVADSQGRHDLPERHWFWYNEPNVAEVLSDLTLQNGQIIGVILLRIPS